MSAIGTRLKQEKEKGNLDFKKWLLAIFLIDMLLIVSSLIIASIFVGVVFMYSALDSSSIADGKLGLSIGK